MFNAVTLPRVLKVLTRKIVKHATHTEVPCTCYSLVKQAAWTNMKELKIRPLLQLVGWLVAFELRVLRDSISVYLKPFPRER